MRIRPLTKDDWAPLGRLVSEAFMRGEMRPADFPEDQRETFPLAKRLGVFVDGELLAALTILDIDVHWDGAVQRMGGIGGVCCASAARGRGYVGAMMRESLAAMREWKQPISGLYPFSHAFYRRFGWESVIESREFAMPTRIIPTFPEGRNVRTFLASDAQATVQPIYDGFASQHQGMTTRRNRVPPWWDRALENAGGLTTYVQVYISPESGEPEGYFTFRYPEAGKPAILGEFIALTHAAYRGLLTTLHNYGSQLESVSWHGPADHPLPLFINEHDVQTTIRSMMMGRIVDVCAALELLRPSRDGSGVIRIHDKHAPWNNGTFAVSATDGNVTVAHSTAAPQCEMDIETLAIACWGAYSLYALREAGRVTSSNETVFKFLAALLPARVPFILDAF